MQLTELQKDGIGELLNIGMGRAASALSEMTGDEIKLSVPLVKLITSDKLDQVIDVSRMEMTAIDQRIEGAFDGNAILLFPEHKSLELVRSLLQDSVPLQDMTEMEEEALSEVGNIILNACLGSLSNVLKDEIRSGLPNFKRDIFMIIIENMQKGKTNDQIILFMQIDFILSQRDINGYLAILLDVGALEKFLKKIDTFIEGVM